MKFLLLLLLILLSSCKPEIKIELSKHILLESNKPTVATAPAESEEVDEDNNVVSPALSVKVFGAGPGNKLLLKEVILATGLASNIQNYQIPGGIGGFALVKNKTRVLVEVDGNTINDYGIDNSVNPPVLTLLSSASVPGNPSGTWGICAAPDGTSAHLVSYGDRKIYSFKIVGDVISYASTTNQAPDYLVSCKVTADSKYVLASGYTEGSKSFAISSATAALSVVTSVGPYGAAWLEQSEDSRFFFVANQDFSRLEAYEVNLLNGSFSLVDTKVFAGIYPDFLDVSGNGTSIFLNTQGGGGVFNVPFNRTTKLFGSETLITSLNEWFTVAHDTSLFFQFSYGNNGTTIYPLNPDGTLGTAGSVLPNESQFVIYQ